MKDYCKNFKGKNITLMGLGLLGRGLGDAKFFLECGANLTITDLKTRKELSASVNELAEFKKGIEYVLGEHRLCDFENKDMIVRAANVPQDSRYLEIARNNGIPIEMDASLFSKLAPNGVQIIGVTGTRGKSTVVSMIESVFNESNQKIYLGGNVKGVATLPLLKEIKKGDVVLMELDSWQLQGFDESRISPQVSIFTSFYPDHLNYYKSDMGRYFRDKEAIYKYQNDDDILVMGEQVKDSLEAYGSLVPKNVTWVNQNDLPSDLNLSVPGQHNRYNAAIVYNTCLGLGFEHSDIKSALESYESMPGRLELVGEIGGVRVYNDTNSTTPEALLAAVNSFPKGKILLIAGGTNKDLKYGKLENKLDDIKGLYLLEGSATEEMKGNLRKGFFESSNLRVLVKKALDAAQDGDVLIFSPGAASFGLFDNEYDRGEKFNDIIKEYEESFSRN